MDSIKTENGIVDWSAGTKEALERVVRPDQSDVPGFDMGLIVSFTPGRVLLIADHRPWISRRGRRFVVGLVGNPALRRVMALFRHRLDRISYRPMAADVPVFAAERRAGRNWYEPWWLRAWTGTGWFLFLFREQ